MSANTPSASVLATPTTAKLLAAIRGAWGPDTSVSPDSWHRDNAALGQCAATALIVQDFFGGDLVRSTVAPDVSHYWNRLPSGTEVDFTRAQFEFFQLVAPVEVRTRGYVLSFPDTQRRYDILRSRTIRGLGGSMP